MAQVMMPVPVAQPMVVGQPPMGLPVPQQPMLIQQPSDVPIKQGWLIKEPVSNRLFGSRKRRWIVLFRDRIEWRETPDTEALGELELERDSEVVRESADVIRIESDGRTLTLHLDDETSSHHDMDQWFALFRQQALRHELPVPVQPQPMAYVQPQPMAYGQPQQQANFVMMPPQQPAVVTVHHHEPEVVVEEDHHGYSAGQVALGVGAGLVAGALVAEALHSHRSSHSSHSSHSTCSSHRSSF